MEKVIKNQFLTGERALFGTKDAEIYDTIFTDGESPLKESSNIGVYGSMFKWKYPLWYCRNISVRDSAWFNGITFFPQEPPYLLTIPIYWEIKLY